MTVSEAVIIGVVLVLVVAFTATRWPARDAAPGVRKRFFVVLFMSVALGLAAGVRNFLE